MLLNFRGISPMRAGGELEFPSVSVVGSLFGVW